MTISALLRKLELEHRYLTKLVTELEKQNRLIHTSEIAKIIKNQILGV